MSSTDHPPMPLRESAVMLGAYQPWSRPPADRLILVGFEGAEGRNERIEVLVVEKQLYARGHVRTPLQQRVRMTMIPATSRTATLGGASSGFIAKIAFVREP
jgi:hypothetical protein